MSYTIIPRHGTVAQWTAKNTVLAEGELGVETDGGLRMWLGDGATPYLSVTKWLASQNATSGQGIPTVINVKDALYGAKGDWNGTTGTDDSAAFLGAINDADMAGAPVYVPAGRYVVSLALTDQNVHLTGPGTLVHQQAKSVLTCRRTPGTSKAVSSIAAMQTGANLPTIDGTTETCTKIALTAGVSGISQGDLFLLASNDAYPFSAGLSVVEGFTANVYQQAFVRVHGLGLDISGVTGGGMAEGDTVTGATSGATGLVLSTTTAESGGAICVIFGTISGAFTNGENLQVGGTTRGTANGTAYLVIPSRLPDTYTTSPVLRAVDTTKKFVVDGLSVEASGNIDTVVGTANRVQAFVLQGVFQPEVRNFKIKSAWTRCWQVKSCYQGDFDVRIIKMSNNGAGSELSFGYGVEIAAASEGCRVKVIGGNMRHGFTTNVYWNTSDLYDNGNPKYTVVHDSIIEGALSASYDTHWGCYFTTFDNCVSVRPGAGHRNGGGTFGFQNRGFGTTFKNCSDLGSVIAFNDQSYPMDCGFTNKIRFQNCQADNYQEYGFYIGGEQAVYSNEYEFIDCDAVGDGRVNGSPYYQVGYRWAQGQVTLKRCTSSRFNGAAFRYISTSGGRTNMFDCLIDAVDCPSGSSGVRFDGAPQELNVDGLKVRWSPYIASVPASVFRVASGSVVMNLGHVSYVNQAPTVAPPLATVTGGSLTINDRSNIRYGKASAVTVASGTSLASLPLQPDTTPNFLRPGSNLYYFPLPSNNLTTTAAMGIGTVRLMPFVVPQPITVTAVGGDITSAGDTGSFLRMLIYADDGQGYPGALVYDQGATSFTDGVITGTTTLTSATATFTSADTGRTITGTGIPGSTTMTYVSSTSVTLSQTSTNGTGLTFSMDRRLNGNSATVQAPACSVYLPAGVYWTGGVVQNVTTTQPTVRGINAVSNVQIGSTGLPATGAANVAYVQSGVTGAPSSTFAAGFTGGSVAPRVLLRVS